MNIVSLYAGDRLVDLSQDSVAETVYGFDFSNPTTRNVDFTSGFKAPMTENNMVTFGYAHMLNSYSVKPYRYIQCRYQIKGIEVIQQGLLTIQESGNYYTLNIFDSEKQLFDTINDLKLYRLNYLTNGPYKNAQIDSFRLSTSGIISPVLDWGVATSASIQPDYYLPTWFYYELVQNCLKYTGLTLDGKIFSSTDFTELVVPFSLSAWEYPTVFTDQWNFDAKNSASTVTSSTVKISISTIVSQGSLSLFSVSNWQYEMPVLGATGNYITMHLKATIRYTSTGSAGNSFYFRIIVLRSAVEITVAEKLETMVAPGGGNDVTLEADFNLQDNDDVYVKYYTNVGTPTVTVSNVKFQGVNTGRIHDNYVFFNYLLPDITMGDLINDFTNRFGMIYRQVGSKLICRTLQEVIAYKNNALDWTSKRAKIADYISLRPDYAKSNLFEYASGEGVTDETWGTGYLTIDNDTLEAQNTTYQSVFENSLMNQIMFVNQGRVPVYNAFQTSFTWNQVNNSGGFVQLQFNSVDRRTDFPVGANIKFTSVGGLYLNVYAEVTAVSFSTNTLVTLNTAHLGAAGSGGTANIVDRSDFAYAPGLKLLTLRARQSDEQVITFDSVTRSDYKVAYFKDAAFTKTCSFQYFVDNYYSNLSVALQKYKAVTRYYNLSQVDVKNYNNHRIIYDSGDYFLVRRIPNFVAGFVTKVEMLLVYPTGNFTDLVISVYPGSGDGVYTGFAPDPLIGVAAGTGAGTFTGFASTIYVGPPI